MFHKDHSELQSIMHYINEIYWSTRWSNGDLTKGIEGDLKDQHFIEPDRRALPCVNGTMALAVAIRSLFAFGDKLLDRKVWIPNMTAPAVSMAADTNITEAKKDYYPIDSNWCPREKFLEENIEKNDVVVVVHTGGIPLANISTIKEIVEHAGAYLIEDLSHAMWSKDGFYVGHYGDIAIGSTYATKSLNSGEGGLIIFDEQYLDEVYVNWNAGRDWKENQVQNTGFNARPSEFQCAILHARIKNYRKEIEVRSHLAKDLDDLISEEIYVPHRDNSITDFSYYKYIVRVTEKEFTELMSWGAGFNWMTGQVHSKPLHTFMDDKLNSALIIATTHICIDLKLPKFQKELVAMKINEVRGKIDK